MSVNVRRVKVGYIVLMHAFNAFDNCFGYSRLHDSMERKSAK
jgi:hypothetical protein